MPESSGKEWKSVYKKIREDIEDSTDKKSLYFKDYLDQLLACYDREEVDNNGDV